MRYTTRQDAIEQAIAPALTDGNYDHAAICDETFEWTIDRDTAGNELLNTGGFEQHVTDDRFWEVVAKHEIV